MNDHRDYRQLDALTVPLRGVNLVEANAGTGKTYNIVSLYLRLLLESAITVDQILVVSFTDAATAELKERVRGRLRRMQTVFETGEGEAEELELYASCPNRETALRQIVRALQSFDQAAIYTIHGFCQRLLSDAAFEAGLSSKTDLITDDDAIRRQLVDDFWHAETTQGSPIWLSYLLRNTSPERLYKQLAPYFSRPLLHRIAASEAGIGVDAETSFAVLYQQAQKDWPGYRDELYELLHNKSLKKNIYSDKLIKEDFRAADEWSASGEIRLDQLQKLARLGSRKVESSVKKGFDPVTHRYLDQFQELLTLAQQLSSEFSRRLAAMRERLLAYADKELPRRKREMRVRHFDDLLRELYVVLQTGQAKALRQAVREQYSAALIDEFQDTDPLQFSIFDYLFCQDDVPVFFVGDPKQAIYAFRGADVYAYLDARRHATRGHRLELNYRSTPALVESINHLFERPVNPFVIDAIDFHQSAAAKDLSGLHIDDKVQPAMQWWQVSSHEGKAPNRRDVESSVAESVATEITALLQLIQEDRVTKSGGDTLQAKDIAVLVNYHNQGRLVKDALEKRGIGCMQWTDENVFQSFEAEELYQVLSAVIEPANHRMVRGALTTEVLGYDAQGIDVLGRDDNLWQELLDRFASYLELWRHHGFARMLRRLMRDFGVEHRLLGLVRGQRRLSNILHLADLLQRESSRRHGRPHEVLIWMREQHKIDRPTDQAMLLRLESDENLVTIMTVHVSKGLQFPVVFCPYLWSAFSARELDVATFHDEHNRPCLDLGSERINAHLQQEKVERLAEQVRLTYVALTRAQLACYGVWGLLPGSDRSGLNWLLHRAGPPPVDVARLKRPTDDHEIASSLATLASDSVTVKDMPASSPRMLIKADSGRSKLEPRALQHEIPRGWRVSSFSALTRHVVEEPRDYDAGKGVDVSADVEPEGIFAFPRGARAGRCMHALFENIAFDATQSEILPVAQQVLREHGYDAALADVLATMAVNVLSTNLDKNKTRLCDVAVDQRVCEMEFYFPTARLNADALRTTLGNFGRDTPIEQRLNTLDFIVDDGFVHGFIDLVFETHGRYYLTDYKSNWLGGAMEDYRIDRLIREISRHDYYLQYLIYSVALHRHLAKRLADYDYDRHFGGAYYLFVRGMQPDNGSGYGVFYDRPDAELMRRLELLFFGQRPGK